MNFAAYQLILACVVCWITTVDGVKVVEPEVVSLKVIERTRVFFTPVYYEGLRIEISGSHLSLYLVSVRTDFPSLRRYTTKDGNHQWVQSITYLHSQRATTGEDNIIKMR